MHIEARNFALYVRHSFPEYFFNKRVLDVGGGDINGNNRHLFENCHVVVNDVAPGPNVTVVSKTKDLSFPPESFDTIVSTECFEHDPEYTQSLQKIVQLLRPGGLFFFSCASTGRKEHGTRRTSPEDSFGTLANLEDMVDYYKNLTLDDIKQVLDLNHQFVFVDAYYNEISKDLYFVGIKKSSAFFNRTVSFYQSPGVLLVESKRNKSRLENVFDAHGSDKNSSFHHYTRQYASLLNRFEFQPVRVLEIGVFKGQSISAWRSFFINAQVVVGVDIDPETKKYEDEEKQIHIEIWDSTDPRLAVFLKDKYHYFDIIIDDGSHVYQDIVSNFLHLYPLLSEDGIYICEDTVCYKDPTYTPDPTKGNHLNFFCQFLPFLNQWRFDSSKGEKDHCVDPFKIQKTTHNLLEASIDKIEFGSSYVAITKKTRFHWFP